MLSRQGVRRVLFLTGGMLLIAAAAFASASGIPAVDTVINTGVRVVQGAGLGTMGYGALGAISHIRGSDWMGTLSHLGLSTVTGGATMNLPTVSTSIGGIAAALVHPVVHPVTHVAFHLATRLI